MTRVSRFRLFSTVALALSVGACGGGSGSAAPEQPGTVTFAFRMHGLPASEEFRVTSSSQVFIAQARGQLALPEAQRFLFATGPIEAGNGGVNLGWNWHLSGVALAEFAIELCDGRPSFVEADLGYWLNTVKSFCPWGSYVYAEIQ